MDDGLTDRPTPVNWNGTSGGSVGVGGGIGGGGGSVGVGRGIGGGGVGVGSVGAGCDVGVGCVVEVVEVVCDVGVFDEEVVGVVCAISVSDKELVEVCDDTCPLDGAPEAV